MSVQPLHPVGVAAALVAQARSAVARGGAVPAAVVSDAELTDLVVGLAELESQVAAWRLRPAAEAESRRVSERTADTDTAAWLARLTQDPREVAAGGLWLARRLEPTYAATREAFAAGRLRADQVRVVVAAAERAPTGVAPDHLAEAEQRLVARATGDGTRSGRPLGARMLRIVARRMFETISREVADRHESDLLVGEERRAEALTHLTITDQGDGTCAGRFVVPELHGRLLRVWLDRLTASRRRGGGPGDATVPVSVVATHAERAGQAFLQLIEHLPTDGWTAGTSIGVLVRIDEGSLRERLGAAGLDTGARCSAGEARRLACSAGILPVVLGGESVPSTSAAVAASTPSPSGAPWRSSTTRAPSSPATDPSPGPRSTTRRPGPGVARPTWPTPYRCAPITTAAPTTSGSS